jgi:hypothetical protein
MTHPARVGPALAELKMVVLNKMGQPVASWVPATISGATPNTQSGLAKFAARGPHQEAVQMHVTVFAHGTRVFQATVLGQTVPADDAHAFFSSLRVLP